MPTVTFGLPDIVVVTGTGSGLGSEIATLLLDCGSKVIGVDLTSSGLSEREGYVQVTGSVADQATWAKVKGFLNSGDSGKLGLVTSAAILDTGFIPDTTSEIIARAMDVNVTGTAFAMGALIVNRRAKLTP